MTPQLQLAIKLLQLSRLELVETIREEMQENPVIEDTAETGEDGVDAAKGEADETGEDDGTTNTQEAEKSEEDMEAGAGQRKDNKYTRVRKSNWIGSLILSRAGLQQIGYSVIVTRREDDYISSFSASTGGPIRHLAGSSR